MSRTWNGSSLVTELSASLGDTSAAFQARVLGWLNDTIFDIASRHDWSHHLTKGKKILSAGEEVHSLEISAPGAPTLAVVAGGSLVADTDYQVMVTFGQANGVETVGGTASAVVTPTGSDLTINLSAIPVSPESLVTERNLYLKSGTGAYYYHSTIFDNVTTTASIDSVTTETIQPPDYEAIRMLKGSPFFEAAPSIYLTYKDIDQLRLLIQGAFTTGSPEYFSPIDSNSVTVYPLPSSNMEVSFNYYRYPFKLYDAEDSQPDLPIILKPVLKAGVLALGYEYRDRDGAEIKRANYENQLVAAIDRGGKVANIEYQVRDVRGGIDGREVS